MPRLSLITVLGFVFILSFPGCTTRTGIVRLNTDPPGAKYYVDGIEKGTTPSEFEWDLKRPIMLEIRKDGYHSEEELLNEKWVEYQASKGNYGEIRIGKATTQWTVIINRTLRAAPPGQNLGAGKQQSEPDLP